MTIILTSPILIALISQKISMGASLSPTFLIGQMLSDLAVALAFPCPDSLAVKPNLYWLKQPAKLGDSLDDKCYQKILVHTPVTAYHVSKNMLFHMLSFLKDAASRYDRILGNPWHFATILVAQHLIFSGQMTTKGRGWTPEEEQ
ncbi:hypothetical protein ACJX0J_024226 [Zea mays]